MEEEYHITTSQYPFNMAGWCREKAGCLVKELAALAEALTTTESIPAEDRENLHGLLWLALWDATKLLSFSCGVDWSCDDGVLILEKGELGYEELRIRYGLAPQSQKPAVIPEEFAALFEKYLAGGRYPGRTCIHDLLNACKIRHRIINDLNDLTSSLSLGEIAWEEYVDLARIKLRELVNEDSECR